MNILEIYGLWSLAENEFEEDLFEAAGGYDKGWDYDKFWIDTYDSSCEFSKVPNDYFLNEAQQNIIKKAGFGVCFINHKNGWESHYCLGRELPVTPWRVRYGSKSKRTVKGGMEVVGIPGADPNEQCEVVTLEDSQKDL